MTIRIAITPGEPAGIGPDLMVALAQKPYPAELIAIADPELLRQRAAMLNRPIDIYPFDPEAAAQPHEPPRLKVLPVSLKSAATPGILDTNNADYVLQCLTIATDGCRRELFNSLVTGPVQKSVINDAGIAFSGHTEFIAARTGGFPVMLLLADRLRVALATTHLPLAEVSRALTPERLERVIRSLHRDLVNRFGLKQPRVLVCGLNPHAGEAGHFGHEEAQVIEPVLKKLRRDGFNLIGPLPADSLFTPVSLQQADAVLAMYHDLGLPVLKHVGFGRAVNVTLGLPIIRTSVDHGTALDLAGTGKASSSSFEAALDLAIQLATTQSRSLIPGEKSGLAAL